MILFILLVLGVALFLYLILGGADFGAGVIEIFTGKRSIHTITKAIAPVWEANHIWLILVVVIVFNGFPKVYATLSNYLHIPIMIVLMGIIFRGTAFTFRHYDVDQTQPHPYYNLFFRLSSIITPFFLGVLLGAMVLGKMTVDESQGFYAVYIAPWFNGFCFSMGLFVVSLCSYLAAIFLVGESKKESEIRRFHKLIKQTLASAIVSGMLVFASAQWYGASLVDDFLASPISLLFIFLASALIPLILKYIRIFSVWRIRKVVVVQIAFILWAWALVQYPVFIKFSNGEFLSIDNCHAPIRTFEQLTLAIVIGLSIILPALGYLFKVFKQPNTTQDKVV
ncbi:cytochrome d ubiquinol oxidase subunit II [Aureispira anguillae]|uniref:Cytochrome d ubiquinol oxidase subunit II n=1 Tax=Aureispira anguillae TaxID=2864201 RepID=A0A915VKG1_9BACT|nr:cytochrome d ubiquinol oxidase subunit II [Aureispira anguillae]BDS09672.1 cytochrome d ubiquinol oxidase subunit II [Aureispira anguillae]